MMRRGTSEMWWILAVIILLLATLIIWAVFTGKVGLFLARFEL